MPMKTNNAATNAAGRKVRNRFVLPALVRNVLCSMCFWLTEYLINNLFLPSELRCPGTTFLTYRNEQQSCGFLPELIPSTACSIGLCAFHLPNRSAPTPLHANVDCGGLLTNPCYAGACRASGCRSDRYLCRLVDARKGDAVISYCCRNCGSHHRRI